MPTKAGGPCQGPGGDGEGSICGVTESTCWYGKRGHQFCSSHRAAWNHWKKSGAVEDDEEPSALTEIDTLLGTRYCEPSKMKPKERRNEVSMSVLQFNVQGTFNCDEDDERGHTDTRWQTLDELVESGCSKAAFQAMTAAHITQLEKTFKRDAKRFKSA